VKSRVLPWRSISRVRIRVQIDDLRRGEWVTLWPFLRWRAEQAPPLRPFTLSRPYLVRNPAASDRKWASILDGRSLRQTYKRARTVPAPATAINCTGPHPRRWA
jgi:hypothetical protein